MFIYDLLNWSIFQIRRIPRFLIDGPYGAPAQEYKQYEGILLIGLGIGATPLISTAKEVLYDVIRYEEIVERRVN